MEETKASFTHFGGHHFSGGFGVSEERVHTLLDDLLRAHTRLGASLGVVSPLLVDAELSLSDVTESLVRTLRALGPYGEGNPKPLFLFRGVVPQAVLLFGKTKEHTKLNFLSGLGPLSAIAFFKTPEQFSPVPMVGEPLDLLAHVEESYFRERREVRLRIVATSN